MEEVREEKTELEGELRAEEKADTWVPRTSLGREVLAGRIKSIDEILESGKRIMEPEIVDYLIPGLKEELISIGKRTGKGGGSQRIPIRVTARMKKSGRRFRMSAFIVVGNEDGYVGIGKGTSVDAKRAIEKARKKARLNIIKVKRGCGSWECGCGLEHSIPYKIDGKSGSVRVILLPAPKGVGLVADDESKKILKLAGIKDVWVKSFGNTSMHLNLIAAIYDALKKLYVYDR
ncbi:MAG: 30S ribosomal protein S5 [Candidatus Aenigmarchaeota archaeon]|nr:30S ribosomal protein S5 [Candidatus Aenigmarchaeota archaeon]MDW8160023.1 30S ribosomal protein S5 [Candidatus Aenigmarchaeota archaeon]